MRRLVIAAVMAAAVLIAWPTEETAAQITIYTSPITGYTDGGVPAAGASGDLWQFDATVNAMDGSDTVAGLVIGITNANHTGSGNTLTALEIEGITGDAQADEIAIDLGSGWDTFLRFGDEGLYRLETTNAIISPASSFYGWHGGGSTVTGTANTTYLYKFYVDSPVTITEANIEITTTGIAGDEVGIGIYDIDGNLLTEGKVGCDSGTTVQVDITDDTIGPGYFYLAYTRDNSSCAFRALNLTTVTVPNIANQGAASLIGTAANGSSDAVFNAATGTITDASVNIPVVFFVGS